MVMGHILPQAVFFPCPDFTQIFKMGSVIQPEFDISMFKWIRILKMKSCFENEGMVWKWKHVLKNESMFRKWRHVLKIKAYLEFR